MTKNERERLEAAEALIDEVIDGKYMKFGRTLRQFFGEYRHRFPRKENMTAQSTANGSD